MQAGVNDDKDNKDAAVEATARQRVVSRADGAADSNIMQHQQQVKLLLFESSQLLPAVVDSLTQAYTSLRSIKPVTAATASSAKDPASLLTVIVGTTSRLRNNPPLAVVKTSAAKVKSSPRTRMRPNRPLASQGYWSAYLDTKFGMVYYFNSETRESVWERPTRTFPAVCSAAAMAKRASAFYGGKTVIPLSPKLLSTDYGDWSKYEDPSSDNRIYYYNRKTGARQWDRPGGTSFLPQFFSSKVLDIVRPASVATDFRGFLDTLSASFFTFADDATPTAKQELLDQQAPSPWLALEAFFLFSKPGQKARAPVASETAVTPRKKRSARIDSLFGGGAYAQAEPSRQSRDPLQALLGTLLFGAGDVAASSVSSPREPKTGLFASAPRAANDRRRTKESNWLDSIFSFYGVTKAKSDADLSQSIESNKSSVDWLFSGDKLNASKAKSRESDEERKEKKRWYNLQMPDVSFPMLEGSKETQAGRKIDARREAEPLASWFEDALIYLGANKLDAVNNESKQPSVDFFDVLGLSSFATQLPGRRRKPLSDKLDAEGSTTGYSLWTTRGTDGTRPAPGGKQRKQQAAGNWFGTFFNDKK